MENNKKDDFSPVNNDKEQVLRAENGRFLPNSTGNRFGRPKGSANSATIFAKNLMGNNLEAVLNKIIEKALNGNDVCLKLVADKFLANASKERPVKFNLPEIKNSDDLQKAIKGVVQGLADGHITPSETERITSVLERLKRLNDDVEFNDRLTALEKQYEERTKKAEQIRTEA